MCLVWVVLLASAASAIPQPGASSTTTTASPSISLTPYIAGGHEVAPNSMPYVVHLTSNIGDCCGSIISQNYVLTARHCVLNRFMEEIMVSIYMGYHNIKNRESDTLLQHVPVENAILHPQADAAVIRMVQPITFTDKIKPVRLPQGEDLTEEFAGYEGTVSGWGMAEHEFMDTLYAIKANVMFLSTCKKSLTYLDATYICLEGVKHQHICYGDSGSPLVVTTRAGHITQIGIAAFLAPEKCQIDLPMGFARVAGIMDWIRDYTDVVFDA